MPHPISNGEPYAHRPAISNSVPDLSNDPGDTQSPSSLQRSRSMPSGKAITNGSAEESIFSSRTQAVYSEAALSFVSETEPAHPTFLRRSQSLPLNRTRSTLPRSASLPTRIDRLQQAGHTNIPPEEQVSDSDTPSICSDETSLTLSTETRSEVPTSLQRSHSVPLGQAVATLRRPASSPGRIGHLGGRSEHSVIPLETHHAAALVDLFERDMDLHFPSGLNEDIRLGLKNHFSDVCRRLAEKGETVEDVQALAEKALWRDHLAACCGGALKEAPAAVAGIAYDLVNRAFSKVKEGENDHWNAAQEGAIGKSIELAVGLLSRPFITLRLVPSEGDRYYLAPNLDMLAEPVKRAKEAIGEPDSKAELWKELGLSYAMWQANGIREAWTSFGMEALYSPAAGHLENYSGNGSRLLMGALKDEYQYTAALKKGHFGKFYLFGRKDWETVYDNLKKSPSYDLVKNPALNAALTVWDSVRAPLKTAKAMVGNTLSPNALGRAVFEVAGGAGTAATRAIVKDAVENCSGARRLYGDLAGRMVSSVPRAVVEAAGETVGEEVKGLYELASAKLKNVCPSSLRIGLNRSGFAEDHPV